MPRATAVVIAFALALGAGAAAAQEQAPPPAAVPQPGQWVLVVPPGSNILVPGYVQPRPSRDLIRLRRVMEIEGPEFSQEKYDLYRSQKGWGIALTVIGGACLGFSYMYTIAAAIFGDPTWGLVGMAGGAAGIGIGIPLMIHGIRGKGRQTVLKRKDEILRESRWCAGLSAAHGGVALGASVAF